MTLFVLKIIGITTMFIDHYYHIIGAPEIFNIIGRISFPIFAFSLSEGYVHTGNLKKYFTRIIMFAILTQAPLFFLDMNYSLNIFFTLFLGMLSVYVYRSRADWMLKLVMLGALLYIAENLNVDYGIYGVLTIMAFNIFRKGKMRIFISFLLLNLVILINPAIFHLSEIQIYSLASLIPIFSYNGKKGRNMKYFFYIFYPAHFLLLEGLNFLIKTLN